MRFDRYDILDWLRRAWLVIRYRPFFKCPICDGSGGRMSGGEESEWSECGCCWRHWNELDDCRCGWFEGRVPLITWIRAKASIRCGLWYEARFRDLIRCKLSIHRWMDDADVEPGVKICCVCYLSKSEAKKP